MGLLDWIKSRNGSAPQVTGADLPGRNIFAPENLPATPVGFSKRLTPVDSLQYTQRGNLIRPVAQTNWNPDHSGAHEFRQHIGRSSEGYHGGFEVAHRGEFGMTFWSNARPTQDAAEKVSYRMRKEWHRGREWQWSYHENKLQRFRGCSWER